MKTLNKLGLILALFAFLPQLSWAGWGIVEDKSYSATLNASFFSGSTTMTIQDNHYPNNPSYVDYVSTKGTLVLGVDKNFTSFYQSTVFNVDVTVDINKWDASGNALPGETKTFSVNYDPERNRTEEFQHLYSFTGAHRFEVTVMSISGSGYSGYFPLNLTFRGLLQVERYYDLSAIDPIQSTTNAVTNEGQLPVSWTVPLESNSGDPLEPEFYELEWTFAEVGEENGSGNMAYAFNFFRNSSRIQIRDNAFDIPFVYPEGLLIWRVRAVGYDHINDRYVYGDWNLDESGNAEDMGGSYGLEGSGQGLDNFVYCSGFHLQENWSYGVNFIENGKYGQEISYFDGLLYNRMEISRANEGEAMVGQTIYDFHRRPAIQLLPTPVPSTLEFIPNFAQASTQNNDEYTWEHFDLDDNAVCVETKTYSMSTNSGPSNYYSNMNTFTQVNGDYLPDAEGYPFTQTEYTPDNTGRIRRQGGVGPQHRLSGLDENDNPIQSHETQYYYDRPLQQQLDRIFGNTVGYAEHYQRNLVIDPNGQISVSYIDPHGRVIATALAGDVNNASMLEPLDAPAMNFETVEVIENSEVDYVNNALVAQLEHVVHTAGVYSISYDVELPQYATDCPLNFCVDCVYDLEISLVDECGTEYVIKDAQNPGLSNLALFQGTVRMGSMEVPLDESCSSAFKLMLQPTDAQAGGQGSTDHLEVYLPKGKFTLYKKLTVNKAALDYYAEQFEEEYKQSCMPSMQEYIDEEKAKFDYNSCFTTCDDCNDLTDPDEKQFCLEQCALLNDPCLLLRKQLEADMSPGGQYFDNQASFDPDLGGEPYDGSIKNDWLDATLGADGNSNSIPDFLESFNASHATSYSSWDEIKADWHDEYVNDFISSHPEYCRLEECETYSDLNSFELELLGEEDGDLADGKGYFNPVNNTTGQYWNTMGIVDPAFQAGNILYNSLGAAQTKIEELWTEIINRRTYNSTTWSTGNGSLPNSCKSDFEWAYFRSRYLDWRREQLKTALAGGCNPTVPVGKVQRYYDDVEDAFNTKGYDLTTTQGKDDFESDFNDDLISPCSTQVNMYLEQLSGCGFSPEHAQLLANEFSFICEHSTGKVDNPYGGTYSNTPTLNGNYSLAQALDWIINTYNYNYSSVCHDLLLNLGIQESGGLPGMAEMDDCVCSKIEANATTYAAGNLPAGICSKEELFEYTYGPINEDLQMLECICKRKADPNFNSVECSQYLGDIENYGDENVYGDLTELQDEYFFKNHSLCINVNGNLLDPKALQLLEFIRSLEANGDLFQTSSFLLNTDYSDFIGTGKLFDVPCSLYFSSTGDPGGTGGTDYIYITGPGCGFSCTINVSSPEQVTPPSATIAYISSYNSGTTNIYMERAGLAYSYVFSYSCTDLLCSTPAPVGLPNVFVPVSLTCNKCIDCEVIQTHYQTFASEYPWALDPSLNNNTLEIFWKYLRVKLGLYYSVEDVKTFLTYCYEQSGQNCTTNQTATDFYNWINSMMQNGDFGEPETFLNANYLSSFVNNPNLYTKGSGCNPVLRKNNGLYLNPGGEGLPELGGSEFVGEGLHLEVIYPSEGYVGEGIQLEFVLTADILINAGTGITLTDQSGVLLGGSGGQGTVIVPELQPGETYHFGMLVTGTDISIPGFLRFGILVTDANGDLLNTDLLIPLGSGDGEQLDLDQGGEFEFILTDDCGTKCTFKFILPDPDMRLENITGMVPGSMEPDEGGIITGNSFKVKVYMTGYTEPVEMIVYSSCHNFFDCDDFTNDDAQICPATYQATTENPCTVEFDHLAEINAQIRYQRDLRNAVVEFRTSYIQTCMAPVENFVLSFEELEYHHTLYYYDRAGNLLRTVPPQNYTSGNEPYLTGTDLLNVDLYRKGQVSTPEFPGYTHFTDYRYNNLNEVVTENTPDGGEKNFWYDYLGRLVLSQNEVQTANKYSYTSYDELGRIVEVGQREIGSTVTSASTGDQGSLETLFTNSASSRTQRTVSFYNAGIPGLNIPNFDQENTLYRIASVALYPDAGSAYSSALHYSYDALGNVVTQIQDVPALASFDGQFKRLDYEFDLLSGNVNYIHYQAGKADRISHHYRYDYKNRLLEAFSSRIVDPSSLGKGYYVDRANSPEWTKEVNYQFYLHGPLSRTETGQYKVQGSDYFYTIQGWMKGVNDELMTVLHDPGQDGYYINGQPTANYPNRLVSRDAFSYQLGYYSGDYSPVNSGVNPTAIVSGSYYGTSWNNLDLYNGNIRNMTTSIPDIADLQNGTINPSPHGATYTYDLLNRIKSATHFLEPTYTSHTWSGDINDDLYTSAYTYDARGNLLTLSRNGDGSGGYNEMDDFIYHYTNGTNQLDHVEDGIDPSYYSIDIDDQGASNYSYDAIGNLVQDNAEFIQQIEWNLYGKIASVTFVPGNGKNNLEFEYDPFGRRILKKELFSDGSGSVSSHYVLDASGKMLAVYQVKEVLDQSMNTNTQTYSVNEFELYGSERLGMVQAQQNLSEIVKTIGDPDPASPSQVFVEPDYNNYTFVLGKKRYEFSNHLGNVLAVVTDRPISVKETSASSVNHFEADIANLYDYYPFGMLLPGRTYSETSCVTQTVSQSNPIPYTWSNIGTGSVQFNGIGWDIVNGGNPGDGGNLIVTANANLDQIDVSIHDFDVTTVSATNTIYIKVKDNFGNEVSFTDKATLINYGPGNPIAIIGGTGLYNFDLSFIPTLPGNYSVEISYQNAEPGAMIVLNGNISAFESQISSVLVCDEIDYRFGFNGQEKDNGISGTGNSMTAEFWQYNSRLGRRFNCDPIRKSWESPYGSFHLNPIFYNDPYGDDPPKEFSKFKRFKNWLAGNAYKNRANAYFVENGIDEKNITYSNGEISTIEMKTEGQAYHGSNGSNTGEIKFVYYRKTFKSGSKTPIVEALFDNVDPNVVGSSGGLAAIASEWATFTAKDILNSRKAAGLRVGTNGVTYQLTEKTMAGEWKNVGNGTFTTKWSGNAPVTTTTKLLSGTGRFLGVASNAATAYTIASDVRNYSNGNIGGARLSFKLSVSLGSVATAAMVGAEFGGPYGAAGGAAVGLIGGAAESTYDNYIKPGLVEPTIFEYNRIEWNRFWSWR